MDKDYLSEEEAVERDKVDYQYKFNENVEESPYDAYARGLVIDYRPDRPYLESDMPGSVDRSGRLEMRENGARGAEEAPKHPELFMGDMSRDNQGNMATFRMDRVADQWRMRARDRVNRFGVEAEYKVPQRDVTHTELVGMDEYVRGRLNWMMPKHFLIQRENLPRSYSCQICKKPNDLSHKFADHNFTLASESIIHHRGSIVPGEPMMLYDVQRSEQKLNEGFAGKHIREQVGSPQIGMARRFGNRETTSLPDSLNALMKNLNGAKHSNGINPEMTTESETRRAVEFMYRPVQSMVRGKEVFRTDLQKESDVKNIVEHIQKTRFTQKPASYQPYVGDMSLLRTDVSKGIEARPYVSATRTKLRELPVSGTQLFEEHLQNKMLRSRRGGEFSSHLNDPVEYSDKTFTSEFVGGRGSGGSKLSKLLRISQREEGEENGMKDSL